MITCTTEGCRYISHQGNGTTLCITCRAEIENAKLAAVRAEDRKQEVADLLALWGGGSWKE